MHLLGKYANIHATYKVAPINNVGRITVHNDDDEDDDDDDATAWLHILSWLLGQISKSTGICTGTYSKVRKRPGIIMVIQESPVALAQLKAVIRL